MAMNVAHEAVHLRRHVYAEYIDHFYTELKTFSLYVKYPLLGAVSTMRRFVVSHQGSVYLCQAKSGLDERIFVKFQLVV